MEKQIFNTFFHYEICCDECNEIIHTHFDCPVCGKKAVGTDTYNQIFADDIFQCENCENFFKKISEEKIEYLPNYSRRK